MSTKGVATNRLAIRDRESKVKRLWEEGMSTTEIASVVGIAPRTAQRIKERLKLTKPGHNIPLTEEELARAKALLDEGCSYKEVERTIGRSNITLRKHLPGYECSAETATMIRSFNRRMREMELK